MNNNLNVGDKVKFSEEKKWYTVKASRGNFAILTYPAFGTCVYSIIDFDNNIRSSNDYVFNIFDYTKQEDIDSCMDRLLLDEMNEDKAHLSQRHKCTLNIESINTAERNLSISA